VSDSLAHEWYPGELEIWREKEVLTVSQFAEKHRKVTLGAHQGDWDNSITPYLVRIMDTYNLPWVQEIVIVGVPQSGKSNGCINMHLFAIVYRGGNVKYVMLPKENLAKKIAKDRLIPIYRMCPPVAKKLSANPDDTTAGRIAFRDGTVIYPVWGSSPSEISSFPADDVLADEVDKNEDLAGKETNALNLMEKRATTFRRPKKIKCSSPAGAGSLITKAFEACMEQLDFEAVCPFCGTRQQMVEDNLTWPGQLDLLNPTPSMQPDVDPKQLLNDKSARYICAGENCGALWNDMDRDRAVRLGDWKARIEVARPVSVGFIIDAFICPDISLSEYAAAIVKARSGDLSDQIELDNSYRAKKYQPAVVGSVSAEYLLKFRSELPRKLVPPETARLALIVDTQQASFYYKVIAYSYAPQVRVQQIRHGIKAEFIDLEGLLAETYQDGRGREFRIASGVIDSGGTRKGYQKHSRTVEVYEWCSRNRIMMPLKGVHGRSGDLLSYKDINTYPGTNKKIPGGLKRVNVRVDIFKDDLERRLSYEPDDPQAMSYNSDIDEAFAKHYTGETKDAHGDWQHSKKSQRIDFWDCDVYALAHREMIKLRIPRQEKPVQITQQPAPARGALPNWFNKRR
jgi:terminase, large subunit